MRRALTDRQVRLLAFDVLHLRRRLLLPHNDVIKMAASRRGTAATAAVTSDMRRIDAVDYSRLADKHLV